MTPLQQQISDAIAACADDIIAHFQASAVPPHVWLGILGCAASHALDAIPQETRIEIAQTFCATLMANARNSLHFDA